MGAWNKFLLLLWKNWKLQLRRPIAFVVEIAIPILVISLFLVMRNYLSKDVTPMKQYDPFPITENPSILNAVNAYYPNDNRLINEVMSAFPNARSFATLKELEDYLTAPNMQHGAVGLVFDKKMPQEIGNAYNVNITIRLDSRREWFTEKLFPDEKMGYGSRNNESSTGGPPDYYVLFAPLMYTLTNRFIQRHSPRERLPLVYLQRFPYPSYESDSFFDFMYIMPLFGFFFMTAFMYSFGNLIKSITYEKEKQLKESMKIMGLPTWLHWTAWYCKMIVPFGLVALLIVIMMKFKTENGKIFEKSDSFLLFVFMFLFVSAIITFAFTCSTLFSKANRAASIGGIIWIVAYVPYLIYGSKGNSAGFKYLASLGVTSAMAYGFDIIVSYESTAEGVNWNNLYKRNEQINVSFGGILFMLLLDIIIYLLAALYIEAIFPGEFGVPKPWYFFLKRSFWSKKKIEQDEYLINTNNEDYFEEEPTDLKAGIMMKNLGKTFGANEAVKGVTLNIYEDQITVLLGHNGAGKTTTMSMLCGMFPPTKGTAIINGYDIRTDIMSVRDSMGICPQHNVLFDELTVKEHLIFFSRLKGCTRSEVDVEVKRYLKLLSLEDKANQLSTALSGGMKRKLCVGIALCGKSKIIMLDEPTAGMDPSARRFIWEFLQKQKKGRTILLTTHFMDEADLLGDRIAIMTGGELSCCGSSFFLKKKYGTGYHLIIDQMPTCNPQQITNVLRKYIPDIEIESNAGTELTYLLPETHASKFTHMLAELENNSEKLGIRSFGISLTDLEEVFMKVGADHNGKAPMKSNNERISNENGTTVNIGISELKNGRDLWLNQMRAMALKKFVTAKRSWGIELLKIVLPVIYVILVIYTGSSAKDTSLFKDRPFNLNQYDRPITLVQTDSGLEKERYINMLNNMKQTAEETDNIRQRILSLTEKSPFKARFRYIAGASFENGSFYAWFNNEPYHSVPLSLQLMLNQRYKSVLGDQYQINFVNFPLPKNISDSERVTVSVLLSSLNVMSISLALAFISTFYILFDIKERNSQAKHLQFVSGINPFIFRFVAWFCDLCTFLIPCVAIIITFALFQTNGLSSANELGILGLLMISFGMAVLPWMYLFSFLFTIPSTGYSRIFFLSLFTGYPCLLIVIVLTLLKLKHTSAVAWVFRVFPHYDVTEGVNDLIGRYSCNIYWDSCLKERTEKECNEELCSTSIGCCGANTLRFAEHGIIYNLLMLYLIAIITFAFLFLIDFKILSNAIYVAFKRMDRRPTTPEHVDSDVVEENMYVRTHSLDQMREQFVLVLKDLTKHYGKLTAVNGLNLTVKKSECFGLLGVNGAGKTTTFKMMTGDVMISHGDGWINGYSIKNEMDKVQRFIGYCPQFDALLDNLTARETLVMFSLIRGVPRDECNYVAEKLAREFDFFQHLDKQVKKMSGGNKRKLSASIALIGDAPIIFLDEPSTGMDPATKRHLWNNLAKIRESGKSIILTSHSMEECEALCTRIAIMVNGNFQCLGSTQHLKSKFAEGYSITLKIKKADHSRGLEHADTEEVEQFMEKNFPTAELREKHQELLTYFVKDKNLTWSKLFGVLEQTKGRLNIEDYSVGQASLEQVFLTFTKNQIGNEEERIKKPFWRLCC